MMLIEGPLSYKITGYCFKVQNKLGRFASERQFCDELEQEFIKNGINYKREFEIQNFEPTSPEGNRVDFLVENKIPLDAKAKKFITKEDYNQMLRYLYASKLKLGLIVNFRLTCLKPKRVLDNRI
jgi:GxxExxY protein